MNKLDFMGIGPKVGVIVLPWLALAIFFTTKFRNYFVYFPDVNQLLFFIGLVFLITGCRERITSLDGDPFVGGTYTEINGNISGALMVQYRLYLTD